MGHDKLKNVFMSMQQCLIEVMKCGGKNNHKLPHMGKEKMARHGLLPDNIAAYQLGHLREFTLYSLQCEFAVMSDPSSSDIFKKTMQINLPRRKQVCGIISKAPIHVGESKTYKFQKLCTHHFKLPLHRKRDIACSASTFTL
jgi:hypothetical protein